MKIDENFHLTYCTNIHPGETWSQVLTNLKQYIPVLKDRLSPTQPFGIGLRLADAATRELLAGNNLAEFQSWLSGQNLYVFTLNGFPYGGFHQQVVKDKVYAPDWSKPERLDYTIRLVKILASLLPAGIDGGISTVPLSYKPWWKKDKYLGEIVLKESSLNLARLTAEMVRIRQETGKLLHLDLEPEPDGQIENTAEVIDYFQKNLLPIGGSFLAEKLAISPELAEEYLREHIRICYDTCHFAVEYEDANTIFQCLQAAGIKIGKIQISAAIKVTLPAEAEARKIIQQRLSPFAESTYLHQVIERLPDGKFYHYQDLVTALPYLENTPAKEWRTHFHVPIFIADYHLLQSTQDDIVTVLNLLQDNPVCNHLEIETYTWDVLPTEIKIDLLASIEREYEWVLGVMNPNKN
ncbi:MAG: metabolite traffic protein EboE [Oscillatoria sp. PMC 1051.18]|nr:metabolite traffic protein EboE [Oscillatoria sp. PMC 1050.18]MEC5028289.1 metabolite traffic protein EboE [Oscillatoria sp. PMC 1051.18]